VILLIEGITRAPPAASDAIRTDDDFFDNLRQERLSGARKLRARRSRVSRTTLAQPLEDHERDLGRS
jgi:hypothetical protein